jgi:hypothetical protein
MGTASNAGNTGLAPDTMGKNTEAAWCGANKLAFTDSKKQTLRNREQRHHRDWC